MRRSDIISGSLLTLFGLAMIFIVVPMQIDSGGDYGLDPKLFPVMVLWLIVSMAVLLVASRVPLPADPPDAAPVLDRHNWMFAVGAALFLLLGFIAIDTVGFMPAAAVMIAVLMYLMGDRHWIRLIVVSVAAPAIIYWLLRHLFSVQLP